MIKLQGIFPALATPFDHAGNLYRAKVAHNIARLNDVGLAGYVVAGSTGESPLLDAQERIQLYEWVREHRAEGKLLIAGTASEGVHETVAPSTARVKLAITRRWFWVLGITKT